MVSHKIAIIGTGNVAWHLAPALERGGHAVVEVYGRSGDSASELSKMLYNPSITENLDFGSSQAKVFILAVSDGAIESIASEIVLPEHAIVVHTSGSVPLSTLGLTASDNLGVFYPLQTFTKSRPLDFGRIPILIEANHQPLEEVLIRLAETLSRRVIVVDSEQRALLHLSAVFVNNFTNHMLSIGNLLMDKHEFDFELMAPLIEETIAKALDLGPVLSQTGPASRGDIETMKRHLKELKFKKEFRDIYKMISQSIENP